jgi:Uma2 family endonuclease
MTVQLRHHRFTVDSYEQMIAHGILMENDRVELLDGEIVEKMAPGTRHSASVDRLNRLFALALGERAIVHVQGPVMLPPHSMPEPDVTILRARADFYAGKRPEPKDILLLAEVSDSSLAFDRTFKLSLYAAAGICEVWIVNLVDSVIECHADPNGDVYATNRVLKNDERLSALFFPDIELRPRDILP